MYKATNMINIPMKVCTHSNYWMFDIKSWKRVQNSKFYQYLKVQNLQVWFLVYLKVKKVNYSRHHKTNNVLFTALYYNKESIVCI